MKKLRKNVLIFPGGTENGLEIARSLKYCKEVTLFSASSAVPNQAMYEYQHNRIISDIRDGDKWICEINDVVETFKIDIIIPANSIVIDYLSKRRHEINCDVLLPPDDIIETTRSKKKTIEAVKNIVDVPTVYWSAESIGPGSLPVFVKPDRGYGGTGTQLIDSLEQLSRVDFSENIVEEYLPGREYTVDCFSNGAQLLFSGGRERQRIRMGTTMHCEEISEELQNYFREMARKILTVFPISGYWFFQVKESKEQTLKLQEIDVRVAGTMNYYRCKGVNFPLLALFQHYGMDIEISVNKSPVSMDRCLKSSYEMHYEYDTVYVDLDDTLICHGNINTQLVSFLYQCINESKKIVLISKNDDRSDYLRQKKLYHIFDEIIWLREEESKTDYMLSEHAIYIDDSYSQRKDASMRRGIPTFAPYMVECLLHERS